VRPLQLQWIRFPSGRAYGVDLGVSPPAVVWSMDPVGVAHLDVPEILRAAGVDDTPENRDTATSAALEAARRVWPDVATEVR